MNRPGSADGFTTAVEAGDMHLAALAMSFALREEREDLVRRLHATGVDLDADDHLANASWDGDVFGARLLLDLGADANHRSGDGSTPMHLAASPWIVDCLMDAGADLNQHDGAGRPPAIAALAIGRFDVFDHLLRRGADPNMAVEALGKLNDEEHDWIDLYLRNETLAERPLRPWYAEAVAACPKAPWAMRLLAWLGQAASDSADQNAITASGSTP